MSDISAMLTIPKMALSLGVTEGQLRRLSRAGRVPSYTAPIRGGWTLFDPKDREKIREVCVAAGLLKPETAAVASGR